MRRGAGSARPEAEQPEDGAKATENAGVLDAARINGCDA
jgi:hypothetical protein